MSRVLGFTGHRDRGIDLPFQTEFFLLSSFLVYLESFNYSYLNRSIPPALEASWLPRQAGIGKLSPGRELASINEVRHGERRHPVSTLGFHTCAHTWTYTTHTHTDTYTQNPYLHKRINEIISVNFFFTPEVYVKNKTKTEVIRIIALHKKHCSFSRSLLTRHSSWPK